MRVGTVEASAAGGSEKQRRLSGAFPGTLEPSVIALVDRELAVCSDDDERARRRIAGMLAARITTRLPIAERPSAQYVFAVAQLAADSPFAHRQLEQIYGPQPRNMVEDLVAVARAFAGSLCGESEGRARDGLRALRVGGFNTRIVAALVLALRRPGGPMVLPPATAYFHSARVAA